MRSLRLKYVARLVPGQAPNSESVEPLVAGFPFLQGNAEFGVESPTPRLQCVSPSKRAAAGDVLISVRAPVGALNIADQVYGIGRGLCAVRAEKCEPRFLWWWLHSQVVNLNSVATGSTYASVTAEDLATLPFPDIPRLLQRRIADFLDMETGRIDKVRAARGRMKALLKLKRERVIERLVEAGNQQEVPLKHLVDAVTVGIVVTPAAWYVEDGGVPALRGINIKPGRIDARDLAQISHEGHVVHRKSRLRSGDLVVVRTGQAGATAAVPPEYDGANCVDLVIVRPGRSLVPRFAEYLLNSSYAKRRVAEFSVGSIQSHFNVAAMKAMPVPRKSVPEQRRIVAEIDRAVEPIDEVIRLIQYQDELLAERRQSLIAAAVTGRVDVPTAQRANLP
ncbi:restriction endonuclease subunit S [Micromonospora yasonensis]|uniref:restriction endonuclease subunit S n=1 Tax=Micromonospora yasonensis TaxID=1128667 RepID=UPI00222F2A21|nr:restriction endonuclease subunit S [Micromonospora yasonensis]MCW3843712.1 restriction endonuclease subunit S [Micromonospora yasonensis]